MAEPYENLRQFLMEVPLLTHAIEAELANEPPATMNSDEIKDAHQQASKRAVEFLREENLPYAVVLYPEDLSSCAECGAEIPGVYWELNNPAGKGMTIPMKLLHAFTEHGHTSCEEGITNLAGNDLGRYSLHIDLVGIRSVLQGIPVPDEVGAELAAV